jgi:two-component system OmpR family sensor kinase
MILSPRLRRLSIKLALVSFGVVAGALAIVYLAVVPRLESRLVDAKIAELEGDAPRVARDVRGTGPLPFPLGDVVTEHAATFDARVVVFAVGGDGLFALADSSNLTSQDVQRDPIALETAETGLSTSGRVTRNGRAFAEVAVTAGPDTVVLLSSPLGDALANVALVRRSVLVAGLVALLVSAAVGFLAAWGFTRRLRRLERAANRIANGDFGQPVVDRGHDEVGQLATAFEGMRMRLSHLDRARREFIANASHELRTPLFSLGGFLELLADEDLDEDTRREFLAETRAQVDRLTRLATDLLDLSRMDAGQLEVAAGDVELTSVARILFDEFRPAAEAGVGVLALELRGEVGARGDEQRVLQIARILVENAVRHTPPGTSITIATASRDGDALLSVRDDGPGIAEEEQPHVFERFYRGAGGTAAGSGLGLAIARELAARMEGRITFDSNDGETVFTLTLPASREPFPRENPSPPPLAATPSA